MFNSIRLKLTLWYIGVLTLIVAIFAFATYSLLVGALQKETDEDLAEMAKNVVTSVRGDQGDEEVDRQPDRKIEEGMEDFRFRDYRFYVFSSDDHLVGRTADDNPPSQIEAQFKEEQYGNIDIDAEAFRVFMLSFVLDGHPYKLYAMRSLEQQTALQRRIRQTFYLTAPLALIIAGMVGYILTWLSLKPLSTMAKQATTISAANLHERLPVVNPKDELGNLALVFNELLNRVDTEFDRQKRFMADASHELRTPLAIIRGESEVALLNDARHVSEYQESLRIVNDESRRLTTIVEDLFTLARADSGEISIENRDVYIDEVVADCVRSIRTLAEVRHITVDVSSVETVVRGDEALLRRLILNLLDNAVKYNFDDGSVTILVGDHAVAISNSGEAIPDEERSRIFDRFYRAERSRTNRGGTMTTGAGLGLSISKWIMTLHGGRIDYSRDDADMNTFLVTFPMSVKD